MPDRPSTARLFDAALEAAASCYGETPLSVTIRTMRGMTVTFEVPPGWALDADSSQAIKIKSPDCFAEILATFVDVGHRMTRQALLGALEQRGRRWSEGTVGAVLSQMIDLGVLNNSQSSDPKGYGLPGWA